jgi:23S rRNA (adenine2503-C2)-methyltransferase
LIKKRQNILGMPLEDLVTFFNQIDQKDYRAKQLMQWVYAKHIFDFNLMTNFNLELRDYLNQNLSLDFDDAMRTEVSEDGTKKWLIGKKDNQIIETVFIPEENRGTLCISSQVGCLIDCPFCATGHQGFNRNLESNEIIGQVILAKELLKSDRLTNIVFMGMGEPLANYPEVIKAIKILNDPHGFNISRRRITVSTSGLVNQLYKLAEEVGVSLAVSLHAANNSLRDELVPINRKHPINELLDACWHYAEIQNLRSVTFEYTMLQGVNDSKEDAVELSKLLKNKPAKVNLIPFNPFPGVKFEPSNRKTINEFRNILLESGIMTTTRKTRGDDIQAACGQLSGQVMNRAKKTLGQKLKKTLH